MDHRAPILPDYNRTQSIAQVMTPNQEDLVGRRIGVYEVRSLLGVGGMGEVYRASDTRLGRDVAIKVLPQSVAHDSDRLVRFEREARLLATLNHPHIGAIYGLEESGGVRALVLELVEGSTLADRLTVRPLPVAEALGMARQIADALEAAHEKGIIHRDLKPGNIIVTPNGVAKVLDFGLAKAFAGDGSDVDLSQLQTVSAVGTRESLILGTPAYMSPEQARGHHVDKRTDIWAFGCILYEMLTGRAAFGGDTVSDTIAAILDREPDWNALPEQTPLAIRHLLRRCLSKDRRGRLSDASVVRIEMEEAQIESPPVDVVVTHTSRRREKLAWMSALALVSLIAAVAIFWSSRLETPASTEEVRTVHGVGSRVDRLPRHLARAGRGTRRPLGGIRGRSPKRRCPLAAHDRQRHAPATQGHGKRPVAVLVARRALHRLFGEGQALEDDADGRPGGITL